MKEQTSTGTGASTTPGDSLGVATKFAFKKSKLKETVLIPTKYSYINLTDDFIKRALEKWNQQSHPLYSKPKSTWTLNDVYDWNSIVRINGTKGDVALDEIKPILSQLPKKITLNNIEDLEKYPSLANYKLTEEDAKKVEIYERTNISDSTIESAEIIGKTLIETAERMDGDGDMVVECLEHLISLLFPRIEVYSSYGTHGGNIINEVSSREYNKTVAATPRQKAKNAFSLVRKKLNEIDKILEYSTRLKEEVGNGWRLNEKQSMFLKAKTASIHNKLKKVAK